MRIVREHGTTAQRAKDAVDRLLPSVLERYGINVSSHQGSWSGDVFTFTFQALGFDVEGTLQVTDNQIVLEAGLPPIAQLFENTIRSSVESELDRLLAK